MSEYTFSEIKSAVLGDIRLKKIVFPILLGSLSLILSATIPLLLQNLIDHFVLKKLLDTFGIKIIIVIGILFIIQFSIQVISTYLLQMFGINIVFDLRSRLIKKNIFLEKKFLDKMDSGDLASRISNDSATIFSMISTSFPNFIYSIIGILVYGFFLFYLSSKLTFIIVTLVPILMIVYTFLGRKLSRISFETQKVLGRLNSYSFFINSFNTYIKIKSTEYGEVIAGDEIITKLKKLGNKQAKIFSIISPLTQILLLICILLVVSYGVYLTSVNAMTIGELIAYFAVFMQMQIYFSNFGNFLTEIQEIKGSLYRIVEILNQDEELICNGKTVEIKNRSLIFKNVSFSYPSSQNSVEIFSLRSLNFSINPGETVAIVGPSGAGKTTIFSLIERLYYPNKGEILVDGFNLNELNLNNYRKQIGYVPQDFAVKSGTVRENLIYGLENSPSDEELIIVLKQVNLELLDLDIFIGENGKLLSEGQRQKLAIAKLLLQNTNILLLDEVTSSLDAHSENRVQNAIKNMSQNKIVILIAHRLSTIIYSDKIIFMENGEITSVGSHKELYDSHYLYKEFIDTQFSLPSDIKSS